MNTFKSDLSGYEFSDSQKTSLSGLRDPLFTFIQQRYPSITRHSYVAYAELNDCRKSYINSVLFDDIGKITDLEQQVMDSISNAQTISDKLDDQEELATSTFGGRVADKMADFGGSWTFILSFISFLLIWIVINVWFLNNAEQFDPYPFILLNLILSCVASLQAPIIMMSQNRQESKDRERGKKDYMINLKSELEIRILQEKIDHMILDRQQELLEVQRLQVDLLKKVLAQVENN